MYVKQSNNQPKICEGISRSLSFGGDPQQETIGDYG